MQKDVSFVQNLVRSASWLLNFTQERGKYWPWHCGFQHLVSTDTLCRGHVASVSALSMILNSGWTDIPLLQGELIILGGAFFVNGNVNPASKALPFLLLDLSSKTALKTALRSDKYHIGLT